MPLSLGHAASSLLIRREAYERADIARAAIDLRLNLTPDEFRVEGNLVVIGPVHDAEALQRLTDDLDGLGLVYFDDFFEMSGNWPEWLDLFAVARGESAGR
jgi:hypothetical protein